MLHMADVGLERNPILCGFGDRCRYLPLELLEWIFAENEKWGSLRRRSERLRVDEVKRSRRRRFLEGFFGPVVPVR